MMDQILTLNDGTRLFPAHAIEDGYVLWVYIDEGITLNEAFELLSDSDKTGKITANNYGSITELLQKHSVNLQDLQKWADLFRTWPYQCRLTVNGRLFIIVHAGFIEDLDTLPDRSQYRNDTDFFLYAREDAYSFGGMPHATVIAGHTPTMIPSVFAYNKGRVYRHYEEEKDCVYYDIDCGAVFRYWGEADSRMACIRLEDESIFYIWSD